MKTTIELPDDLLIEIKLRAVREGRKLKDAVADLLRQGMIASSEVIQPPDSVIIRSDRRTGLPVVVTRRRATAEEEFSPNRVAELLIEQEVARQHDASRY